MDPAIITGRENGNDHESSVVIDQIKHEDIRKLIDEMFFQVVNKIPEPYNNTNAFGIIIITKIIIK